MSTSSPDLYNHPVFTPLTLLLETPAMARLKNDIHRWMWTGATGAIVAGKARVGKTTAIRHLSKSLRTRGGHHVPSFFVSITRRDTATISSVFRNLCLSSDLRVTNHDRADHLSDRFVHYVCDTCLANEVMQAVLFVDEMQRLAPRQLDAFAEIYDDLARLGIGLLVIFIGNDPECWRLAPRASDDQYAHVYGRFFTQHSGFQGLLSKNDVQSVVKQYDNLRYPADGPTYTGFFLPDAVRSGWRLSSMSDMLWRGFRRHQKAYQIPSWGMQYFTATVNVLLSDYLPRVLPDAVDDDLIDQCIALSGLVPDLVKTES
ncbi:MAG: ATP-binding protein [Gammaproteobacteria bacterium]|nr:ATP-binding protein [Gammaproteobacteria bacterium]